MSWAPGGKHSQKADGDELISGAEIAGWFGGGFLGIISLSLLASSLDPRANAHFGGLEVLGILFGIPAGALMWKGWRMTIRRRERDLINRIERGE